MLKALKNMFSSSSKTSSDSEDLTPELAAAALLVETALADGEYIHAEEKKIRQCLKATFELDDDAVGALLERAEVHAKSATDLHRFTHVVKNGLSHDQRLTLMENMWRVVMADGNNDETEDSLLRKLGPLLALSDRERVLARQRAEARQD